MSGVPSALIVGVTHDKVTLRVGCCSGFDATIVTAVEAVLEPPGPVQVSVKMLFGAVSRPVLALPVVGRTPPHHVPPATQLVAFVEDQVSIELSPNRMLLGLAASVIAGSWPGGAGGGVGGVGTGGCGCGGGGGAGAGGGVVAPPNVTVVDTVVEPPGPEQVSRN